MTLPCAVTQDLRAYEAQLDKQDMLDRFHFLISEPLMSAVLEMDPTEPEYLKRIRYKKLVEALEEAQFLAHEQMFGGLNE